jgi:HK97 family phage major capsid protein
VKTARLYIFIMLNIILNDAASVRRPPVKMPPGTVLGPTQSAPERADLLSKAQPHRQTNLGPGLRASIFFLALLLPGHMQEYAMNIQSLTQERAQLFHRADAILNHAETERRGLTADEQVDCDAAATRIASINADLKGTGYAPGERLTADASDPDAAAQAALRAEVRPGNLDSPIITAALPQRLRAFASNRDGNASAFRFGMWLRGTVLGDAKAQRWMSDHSMPVDVRAAHSASDNAKGGVLVPDEFSANIIRLVEKFGVFRANTQVIPMTTDLMHIARRTGGLTAVYTGEGAAGTESDSAWDDIQLSVKKLMILTRMSSELNEDSLIPMSDMLATECATAFALKEDTVGFTGTGISTDGGIVGIFTKIIDGTHALAAVDAASGHDQFGEIDADDLLALMSAVAQFAKPGAAFYCSPTALELVFNAIKIAGGGTSLEVLANSVEPKFLGYPINVTTVLPDVTTALNNVAMLGFGNLAMASTLGARRDLRFALSDAVYWTTDQIAVKATMRHDINVHDLGSATIKPPFACLIGNT